MIRFFADTEAFSRPIAFLFSGAVFCNWPIITRGALDGPSLHKGYFVFCYSSLISGLLVIALRWIGDRRRRAVRRTLCAVSLMIFVQSLSVLTITFYDPLRYVHAMGFTSMRAVGLMFGLAGYATVFAFVAWASGLLPPWSQHRLEWTGAAGRGFEVLEVPGRGAGR